MVIMKKTNEEYLKLAETIGHLNASTMEKIQALRLNGRTVLNYVKSASNEKWKKPADVWIDELYERMLMKK